MKRNDLEPPDCDQAVESTGDHVKHCEEDRVSETIEAEKVFVEEEDADVG